jgi:hypothetical protein
VIDSYTHDHRFYTLSLDCHSVVHETGHALPVSTSALADKVCELS